MLRKKPALILSSVAITLLASASYASDTSTVLPSDLKKGAGLPQNKKLNDNSWIKNPQTTTTAEAAEKARQERLAKMQTVIGESKASNPETLNSTQAAEKARQERLDKMQAVIGESKASDPEKLNSTQAAEKARQEREDEMKAAITGKGIAIPKGKYRDDSYWIKDQKKTTAQDEGSKEKERAAGVAFKEIMKERDRKAKEEEKAREEGKARKETSPKTPDNSSTTVFNEKERRQGLAFRKRMAERDSKAKEERDSKAREEKKAREETSTKNAVLPPLPLPPRPAAAPAHHPSSTTTPSSAEWEPIYEDRIKGLLLLEELSKNEYESKPPPFAKMIAKLQEKMGFSESQAKKFLELYGMA